MDHNKTELKTLHKKLQKHVEEQSKNWTSFIYAQINGFYQGFDEIKINGCRPTEKRFARYKIEKYLSKNKTALDIGSNCGFFTIYVARFLTHIDGIEINPFLVEIGKDVAEYLKVNNVNFYASSFEKFTTQKQYDIIFSLANDETIDGNTSFTFREYVEKIIQLLKHSAYLIFETVSQDAYNPKRFKPKLELLKNYFTILDDRMVKSEYPINVPERRFLILQKL